MEALPKTADCCSRSAQIFANEVTSSQRPRHRSHSSTAVEPIVANTISTLQRGQLRPFASLIFGTAAAAPQRWQCLLPMNIIAKHDGHATVARREPQNWQTGASVEVAAPQFGQLSVSACIGGILTVQSKCGLAAIDCAILGSAANSKQSNVQGPMSNVNMTKGTLDIGLETLDK